MIRVFGPHYRAPTRMKVINVTSRSRDWGKELSPFFLGPITTPEGRTCMRFENLWQFSKVYKEHVDENNDPTEKYWSWASDGWNSKRAHRYPMGKGAAPLYSLWGGKRYDYIEARKKIYVPEYAKCVRMESHRSWIAAWKNLEELYGSGETFGLWDFDGYDHHLLGMTLEQVRDDHSKKMGHAFVLAMMLEGIA